MIRAMALWHRDIRVVLPLLVLHLGQWAVNIRSGFTVKETWAPIGNGFEGCHFVTVAWGWVQAQFIYGKSSKQSAMCEIILTEYMKLWLLT